MHNKDDLKNVFGTADEQFVKNVYRTLDKLEKDEGETVMKKKSFKALLLVAVLACVMITTVVFAMTNHWGLMDFLSERRMDVETLLDAKDIIQENIKQTGGITEDAEFKVREAVFDGKHVYLVLEAKPTKEEIMLLGSDAIMQDFINSYNLSYAPENKQQTIEQYAKENNKQVFFTSVYEPVSEFGFREIFNSYDYLIEDDGTLVYMMNGAYDGNETELPITLTCDILYAENREKKQTTELSFTLKSSDQQNIVSSTEPVIYEDCGVRVDRVTLVGTPMAIYTTVEFSVIDEEKYALTDDGLWFEFLDENGERLPDGAPSGGSVEEIRNTKTFIQRDSLNATDVLPDKVILRGFNCWEKNRYETHEFEMTTLQENKK